MRQLLLLLVLGLCIGMSSCRNDFEFEPSSGGLEFSRDTVYLDTVFTNIGSSTYTLKVYNRSNKDISIPSIKLKKGDSKYRLMVDGIPGQQFNNVEVLAKDSMYVFIETTVDVADANPTDFLYTDEIEFTSTNGTQEVHLVTLIQDAYFLYPQRYDDGSYENVPYNDTLNIYGFNLDHADINNGDEYHWRNDKPYVVYGYATVPNGETLTVDAGARVHFHADSGLLIKNGGKLNINGSLSTTEALENEIIFEGDRLEPDFSEIPGQWGAVILMSEQDNTINHLTLKNANIGILAQAQDLTTVPKLRIDNSQIYNSSNFGILAVGANISGENFVASNAGQASVALTKGGIYDFKYSTFANYFSSYNQVPLLLNDHQAQQVPGNLSANFDNCIVYGSGNVSISMEKLVEGNSFHIRYNNCLMKMVDYGNQIDTNPLYPGEQNDNTLAEYTAGCKIARASNQFRPDFVNAQNNNLHLITGTSGEGPEDTADATITTVFTTDLDGITRGSTPDMGAYQSLPAED